MSEFVLLAAVMFALGIAFLLAGALVLRAAYRKDRRCTAPAEGEVTELLARSGSTRVALCPVVRYTAGGETLQLRSGLVSAHCPFTTHERLAVRYDPAAPRRFVLPGELALRRRLALQLALCGGACALLGAVFLAVAGR